MDSEYATSLHSDKHRNEDISNYVIESFTKKLKISIKHQNTKSAKFVIPDDVINLPFKHYFKKLEGITRAQNYYSTLFHEIIHWSGHRKRLKRDSLIKYDEEKKDKKTIELMILEELTAEMGSVLLCEYFDLCYGVSYYNLQYINGELSLLEKKNQIKIYNKAIKQAQKAFEYLIEIYEEEKD